MAKKQNPIAGLLAILLELGYSKEAIFTITNNVEVQADLAVLKDLLAFPNADPPITPRELSKRWSEHVERLATLARKRALLLRNDDPKKSGEDPNPHGRS